MTTCLRGTKNSSWNVEVFEILLEVYNTLIAKNYDYGKEPILRKGMNRAIQYTIDQLFSKLHRIEQLIEREPAVMNESIRDSLIDTIGYSIILITLLNNTFNNKTIKHQILQGPNLIKSLGIPMEEQVEDSK